MTRGGMGDGGWGIDFGFLILDFGWGRGWHGFFLRGREAGHLRHGGEAWRLERRRHGFFFFEGRGGGTPPPRGANFAFFVQISAQKQSLLWEVVCANLVSSPERRLHLSYKTIYVYISYSLREGQLGY